MVDKTRRATRQRAEKSDRNSTRSVLRVTLPAFVVLVLQQRAKDQHVSVSSVVETLLLETIMTNELQAMARQSPDFARIAEMWFRDAVTNAK